MNEFTSATLDQCTLSQLKGLLSVVLEEKNECFSLPAQATAPAIAARLLDELLPEGGPTGANLLEIVSYETTRLDKLLEVKNLAKLLVDKADTDRHRNAAILLYHAAIAAAYGRERVNLSSRPIESRLSLYDDLALALRRSPLGKVFRQSVEHAAAETRKRL